MSGFLGSAVVEVMHDSNPLRFAVSEKQGTRFVL